jgi:hypothetical protein
MSGDPSPEPRRTGLAVPMVVEREPASVVASRPGLTRAMRGGKVVNGLVFRRGRWKLKKV